jgi:hypothetical protein
VPHDMDETTPESARNPYRFERDEALETYARGVIAEAIAKSAASPRRFGNHATMAARQVAHYVLDHFVRRAPED